MYKKCLSMAILHTYLFWNFAGCMSFYPMTDREEQFAKKLNSGHSILVTMKNGREYEFKRGYFFEVPLEGAALVGANGKQLNRKGFEVGDRYSGVILRENVTSIEKEDDDISVWLNNGTHFVFSSDLVFLGPDTASPGIVGIGRKDQEGINPGESRQAMVFSLVRLNQNKIDKIYVEETDPAKTALFIAASVVAMGAVVYAIGHIVESAGEASTVSPDVGQ